MIKSHISHYAHTYVSGVLFQRAKYFLEMLNFYEI